jgi:hypothetical protein
MIRSLCTHTLLITHTSVIWEISLYLLLAIPVLYVLRKPFLRLLTPQGIKGIPAYPDSKPFWGDLGMMGKAIEASNSFSKFFDQVAQGEAVRRHLSLIYKRCSLLTRYRPRADCSSSSWTIHEVGLSIAQRSSINLDISLLVLSDYPEIESILLRPIGTFDRSIDTIRVFKHILPSALLTLRTDETYKHHRRVIGPAMTSKYLSMSTPKAAEAAKSLVDYWKVKVDKADGKAFAAETDMESATMVSLRYSVTC